MNKKIIEIEIILNDLDEYESLYLLGFLKGKVSDLKGIFEEQKLEPTILRRNEE